MNERYDGHFEPYEDFEDYDDDLAVAAVLAMFFAIIVGAVGGLVFLGKKIYDALS